MPANFQQILLLEHILQLAKFRVSQRQFAKTDATYFYKLLINSNARIFTNIIRIFEKGQFLLICDGISWRSGEPRLLVVKLD